MAFHVESSIQVLEYLPEKLKKPFPVRLIFEVKREVRLVLMDRSVDTGVA